MSFLLRLTVKPAETIPPSMLADGYYRYFPCSSNPRAQISLISKATTAMANVSPEAIKVGPGEQPNTTKTA